MEEYLFLASVQPIYYVQTNDSSFTEGTYELRGMQNHTCEGLGSQAIWAC